MNINPFIELFAAIAEIYWWVLLFSIILSWLMHFGIINRFNPVVAKIYEILFKLTEPVLKKIRRYMPDLGGVDFSPVVLLLALSFVKNALFTYFYKY